MTIRPARLLYVFFILWLFFSALYYAPNLISGNLIVDRSDDFWHKIVKYIVIGFIGLLFFLIKKKTDHIVQVFFLSFFAITLLLLQPFGSQGSFGFDAVVVLLLLCGLTHFVISLQYNQLRGIARVVIISAIIASVISYFEYFIFEPVLGEFWERTGGFRAVSTMLNPNNFGVYLGCALVLLLFSDIFKGRWRFLIGVAIFSALLLTGSRTAWVSLLLSVFFGHLYRGGGKFKFSAILHSIFFLSVLLALVMFFLLSGVVELPARMLDFQTASIRLDKYFEYLTQIDSSYFFPDSNFLRIDMVSESSYFHFLNAMGFFLAVPVLLYCALNLNASWFWQVFSNHAGRCFDIAVFYFAVAMLFENVFMSFPCNQLFFVSLGASIACFKCRASKCDSDFYSARTS